MAVLVLLPDSDLGIDRGSGVVLVPGPPGQGVPVGSFRVWFEGNRHGAANMERWADRVHHAADRALAGYPTVATGVFPAEKFRALGFYDPATGRFDWQVPRWRTALSEYLGRPVTDEDITTTVTAHDARRAMAASRTGTAMQQQQARALSAHDPAPYRGTQA